MSSKNGGSLALERLRSESNHHHKYLIMHLAPVFFCPSIFLHAVVHWIPEAKKQNPKALTAKITKDTKCKTKQETTIRVCF